MAWAQSKNNTVEVSAPKYGVEYYRNLYDKKRESFAPIRMALVGKENTGKSAIVFDFYQRYCDKHGKGGRQTTLLEFDEEDEENE